VRISKRSYATVKLPDFTGLGLAEITRKKEGQRLEELIVDTAGAKL
jgi:Ribonuclease G/E